MSNSNYLKIYVDGERKTLHRHTMEEYLGRPLEPEEHVYHLNGDILDNAIENLVIVKKRILKTRKSKKSSKYKEVPMNPQEKEVQSVPKAYKRGACKIIVSPPASGVGWHMSISCESREPKVREIREAWYELVPVADKKPGAMFFRPKSECVNADPNCFHIFEVNEDIESCTAIS